MTAEERKKIEQAVSRLGDAFTERQDAREALRAAQERFANAEEQFSCAEADTRTVFREMAGIGPYA
jgi:hypothetical protein